MKKFKIPLAILGIAIMLSGAIAAGLPAKKAVTESWYELVENGSPLNRTDWIESNASSCPTTPSSMPCRILAEADGEHPSLTSFAAVVEDSEEFTIANANVKYIEQ